MAGTHARKAPSGSERWMNCPGSIPITETMEQRGDIPERDDPDYTKEGLCAHELAALCLKTNTDGWEHLGQSWHGAEVTAEMAEHVQLYLDTIRALVKGNHGGHFIEQHVGDAETGGTIDDLYFDMMENTLDITDLKYGEGIAVDAIMNTQLLTYAWEAFDFLQYRPNNVDNFKITLRIVQPRAFHASGLKVRTFELTYRELRMWFEVECAPARARVDSGDAKLMPGEWCRFCPAKLGCPAVAGMFEVATKAQVEDVKAVTDERLGIELEMVATVKMYLKALEEEVFRRLTAGHLVPGWKLVNKKADRVWKQTIDLQDGKPPVKLEEAVKAALGDQELYTKPSLKSPAQIEKLIGGERFVSLWAFKPQTGMTLAPAGDNRPGIVQKPVAERFKSVVVSAPVVNTDDI